MPTRRLCNRGKGVHRLPLPLSGGAAGGGAASRALCQSPEEQQAERTTRSDFWSQHSCNVDRAFTDRYQQEKGKTGKTDVSTNLHFASSVASDLDTDVTEEN